MKRRAEWMLVAIALLAIAGPSQAGVERVGTTSANFLSVGSGAGILGMGGATLGWGEDLNAVSWNPAALGFVGGTQVVVSHAGVGDQSSQEWAAVGGKFLPLRAHWALTGLYHGDGSFDGMDASGVSTGSFGVSSMAFGATFARSFAGIATVGLGAKFVTEKLGDVTGTGGTFDAGLMVRTGPFGIGAAAQNFGGRMNYGGPVYPMPANYGIGASFDHAASGVRVALDLNFPSAYYSDVRTGLEWRWRDRLALRTGYRRELGGASDDPLTGPTFGLGAGARGMWFDYGYLLGGNGGGQHRLGITFHPGGLLGGDDASGHYGSTVRPIGPSEAPAPRTTVVKSVSKSATRMEQPGVPEPRTAKAGTSEPSPTSPPQTAIAKPGRAPASTPVEVENQLIGPPDVTTTSAAPAATDAGAAKPATPASAGAPAKVEAAPPATPAQRPARVTVKAGETLYQIAKRWGTSVPAIMMENNMVSDQVRAGQTLRLPRR
jgi:LysM repeat protein